MRKDGISARVRKRFVRTTDSSHNDPIAPNELNREFQTEKPNRAWVGDITYIWTAEGWMFLAVVLDLFSRRVVGWAMADNMRKELVMSALDMALGSRELRGKLMSHSDRGSQYTSDTHRQRLKDRRITCSMSRRGNCWDNAVAESFFGTLKNELIYRQTWRSRKEAREAVYEYIEVFYNRQRRHSTLGHVSPVEFERNHTEEAAEVA
jgi:putative transposase